MTRNPRRKCKYLVDGYGILREIKNIFHYFKWLSIVKNCLRLESGPLNLLKAFGDGCLLAIIVKESKHLDIVHFLAF